MERFRLFGSGPHCLPPTSNDGKSTPEPDRKKEDADLWMSDLANDLAFFALCRPAGDPDGRPDELGLLGIDGRLGGAERERHRHKPVM